MIDQPKGAEENPRGKPFEKGNPGRPPGSKNRTSLVAAALLSGEESDLVRKAVELAKAGNVNILKFLLGRILPRERTVKLDLPTLESAIDSATALERIVEAVADGTLSPAEGAAIANLISAFSQAAEIADHEIRLARLEALIEHAEQP
jgi:hypothetical protein